MARPKNADSQDTWNRIIAATRQELTNGAAGSLDVSMRQVALTSGVSLGTIHYYFSTKESLLEACLDAYYIALRELAVEFAADLSQGTRENARQLLSESVRRLYRFVLSERARPRLLALTNTQRGHYHPFRMAHEREPYLAWFSTILTRLVDIDEAEVRATFTTMNYVVMQYVLCCDDDLVMVVGVGGDEGRRRIEDHVVGVALRLSLNDRAVSHLAVATSHLRDGRPRSALIGRRPIQAIASPRARVHGEDGWALLDPILRSRDESRDTTLRGHLCVRSSPLAGKGSR